MTLRSRKTNGWGADNTAFKTSEMCCETLCEMNLKSGMLLTVKLYVVIISSHPLYRKTGVPLTIMYLENKSSVLRFVVILQPNKDLNNLLAFLSSVFATGY